MFQLFLSSGRREWTNSDDHNDPAGHSCTGKTKLHHSSNCNFEKQRTLKEFWQFSGKAEWGLSNDRLSRLLDLEPGEWELPVLVLFRLFGHFCQPEIKETSLNRIKLVDQNATADMILLHYQEKEEKVEVDMSANPDSSSNTLQVRGKPKVSRCVML